VNEAKIRETVAKLRDADKALVDSWNSEFGWGRQPHIEDRVAFMDARLKNAMAGLVLIGDALTECPTDSSSEGAP